MSWDDFWNEEDEFCEGNEWAGDTEEEAESLLGTIDIADCPYCGGDQTLRRKKNTDIFKCTACGFMLDDQTLCDSLVGLTKFNFEDK